MNAIELGLCTLAVLSSSLSQLLIKSASIRNSIGAAIIRFAAGAALALCSVLLAVLALRTMPLSRLVPFAALAYISVPLGGHFFFGERLPPRFLSGTILIITGILFTNAW